MITQSQYDSMMREHLEWLDWVEGARRADFSRSDLSHIALEKFMPGVIFHATNLRGQDLSHSHIPQCDFTYSDLRDTNFTRAFLCESNFSRSDMTGAKLHRADLRAVVGNRKQIKSMQLDPGYSITYTDKVIQVGCQQWSFRAWRRHGQKAFKNMDGEAAETFGVKYQDLVLRIATELDPAEAV